MDGVQGPRIPGPEIGLVASPGIANYLSQVTDNLKAASGSKTPKPAGVVSRYEHFPVIGTFCPKRRYLILTICAFSASRPIIPAPRFSKPWGSPSTQQFSFTATSPLSKTNQPSAIAIKHKAPVAMTPGQITLAAAAAAKQNIIAILEHLDVAPDKEALMFLVEPHISKATAQGASREAILIEFNKLVDARQTLMSQRNKITSEAGGRILDKLEDSGVGYTKIDSNNHRVSELSITRPEFRKLLQEILSPPQYQQEKGADTDLDSATQTSIPRYPVTQSSKPEADTPEPKKDLKKNEELESDVPQVIIDIGVYTASILPITPITPNESGGTCTPKYETSMQPGTAKVDSIDNLKCQHARKIEDTETAAGGEDFAIIISDEARAAIATESAKHPKQDTTNTNTSSVPPLTVSNIEVCRAIEQNELISSEDRDTDGLVISANRSAEVSEAGMKEGHYRLLPGTGDGQVQESSTVLPLAEEGGGDVALVTHAGLELDGVAINRMECDITEATGADGSSGEGDIDDTSFISSSFSETEKGEVQDDELFTKESLTCVEDTGVPTAESKQIVESFTLEDRLADDKGVGEELSDLKEHDSDISGTGNLYKDFNSQVLPNGTEINATSKDDGSHQNEGGNGEKNQEVGENTTGAKDEQDASDTEKDTIPTSSPFPEVVITIGPANSSNLGSSRLPPVYRSFSTSYGLPEAATHTDLPGPTTEHVSTTNTTDGIRDINTALEDRPVTEEVEVPEIDITESKKEILDTISQNEEDQSPITSEPDTESPNPITPINTTRKDNGANHDTTEDEVLLLPEQTIVIKTVSEPCRTSATTFAWVPMLLLASISFLLGKYWTPITELLSPSHLLTLLPNVPDFEEIIPIETLITNTIGDFIGSNVRVDDIAALLLTLWIQQWLESTEVGVASVSASFCNVANIVLACAGYIAIAIRIVWTTIMRWRTAVAVATAGVAESGCSDREILPKDGNVGLVAGVDLGDNFWEEYQRGWKLAVEDIAMVEVVEGIVEKATVRLAVPFVGATCARYELGMGSGGEVRVVGADQGASMHVGTIGLAILRFLILGAGNGRMLRSSGR